MQFTTGAHHDFRQRVDIARIGMKIDDARAQHVAAVHDRVRDKGLAVALQMVEYLRIQVVQILDVGRFLGGGAEVGRDEAERRDAE